MPAQAQPPWLLMAQPVSQLSIRRDSRPSSAHAAHLVPDKDSNTLRDEGSMASAISASDASMRIGCEAPFSPRSYQPNPVTLINMLNVKS